MKFPGSSPRSLSSSLLSSGLVRRSQAGPAPLKLAVSREGREAAIATPLPPMPLPLPVSVNVPTGGCLENTPRGAGLGWASEGGLLWERAVESPGGTQDFSRRRKQKCTWQDKPCLKALPGDTVTELE